MKENQKEEALRESSATLVRMATASGVCPKCQSPMIPGSSKKTAVCSNGACSLGIVPKCRTYEPAKTLFQSLRKQKELEKYPKAEKVRGKKGMFSIGGKIYARIRSIGPKAALVAMSPRQKTMLEVEGAPKEKESLRISENKVIASSGKSLGVFELVPV